MKIALYCIGFIALTVSGQNLLKNGSFEGSRKYWMERGEIDDSTAAQGQYSLKIAKKGGLRSGSFRLEPGKTVTISMDVRSTAGGEVRVSISPSNREVGQRSKWVWNRKKSWAAKVGPEWKRVSWKIRIPQINEKGGFIGSDRRWWNGTSWIMMISGPAPYWIDGVSVAYDKGSSAYVPHTPVEVTSTVELKRYTIDGNILTAGSTVNVRVCAFNPSKAAKSVALRCEVLDYEGRKRFGNVVEEQVKIEAGKTLVKSIPMPLKGRGLMLARASILDGGKVIAKSDQPLTVLAYPKAATKPNWDERFGASIRGYALAGCAQKIGLGWTRWYPQLNWPTVQKNGPNDWQFPDEKIDKLHSLGIITTAVLHNRIPKWAGGDKRLPKDMKAWGKDEKRWDDLTLNCSWDRYVRGIVKHYKGKPIVWEIANEPDLDHWDSRLYYLFARRTYRLIKEVDPTAKVQANVTWPGVSEFTTNFLKHGGGKCFDIHTFHNYGSGGLARHDSIRDLQLAFKSYGARDKEIWFNEGWTFVPTSEDYAAPPIIDQSAPEVAHGFVRDSAGLFAAGMEKLITFHIGYEKHGKSFWDWVGSGTEWWDDHGNPTVAVGVMNVLVHHLGLSKHVATIRPKDARIHVFNDNRNGRGVAVVWSDKAVELKLPLAGLTMTDVMGNPETLDGNVVKLAVGRPVYLFRDGLSGEKLAEALKPLEPKKLAMGEGGNYFLPKEWAGSKVGSADGNPFTLDGKPLWRFDQLWPADPTKAANYKPMTWKGKEWHVNQHGHGGQPQARLSRKEVTLGVRNAWSGNPGNKYGALTFVVPQDGEYELSFNAKIRVWTGRGPSQARVFHVEAQTGAGKELLSRKLQTKNTKTPSDPVEIKASVAAAAGDWIVITPKLRNGGNAGNLVIWNLSIVRTK